MEILEDVALPPNTQRSCELLVVVDGIPLKAYPNIDESKFFLIARPGVKYSLKVVNKLEFKVGTRVKIDGQQLSGVFAVQPLATREKSLFCGAGGVYVQLQFAIPNRTLTVTSRDN